MISLNPNRPDVSPHFPLETFSQSCNVRSSPAAPTPCGPTAPSFVSHYFLCSTLRAYIPLICITLLPSPLSSPSSNAPSTPPTPTPSPSSSPSSPAFDRPHHRNPYGPQHGPHRSLSLYQHLCPRRRRSHRHLSSHHCHTLLTHHDWHSTIAATPKGPALHRQLTHLCVMGHQLVPPPHHTTHLDTLHKPRPSVIRPACQGYSPSRSSWVWSCFLPCAKPSSRGGAILTGRFHRDSLTTSFCCTSSVAG